LWASCGPSIEPLRILRMYLAISQGSLRNPTCLFNRHFLFLVGTRLQF
jgi:hypothetical protein